MIKVPDIMIKDNDTKIKGLAIEIKVPDIMIKGPNIQSQQKGNSLFPESASIKYNYCFFNYRKSMVCESAIGIGVCQIQSI